MTTFERTVVARAEEGDDGVLRATARVDDWFHGFEATLLVRHGEVVGGSATAHRTPWVTCPGATRYVAGLRGPVETIGDQVASTDRSLTCVHLNDVVWLASKCHRRRRYDAAVTRTRAELRRDGELVLGWDLDGWRLVGPAPFTGLGVSDRRWGPVLDEAGADADLREAVRVMRRSMLVGIGYHDLDWSALERAGDAGGPHMLGSCHTYSEPQLSVSWRTARVPDAVRSGGG